MQTIIDNSENIKKFEPLGWWDFKNAAVTLENWKLLEMLKLELPYDPEIALLSENESLELPKTMHMNGLNNIIHNEQKVETAHVMSGKTLCSVSLRRNGSQRVKE